MDQENNYQNNEPGRESAAPLSGDQAPSGPVESRPTPLTPEHNKRTLPLIIGAIIAIIAIGGVGYVLMANNQTSGEPSAATTVGEGPDTSHESMSPAEHIVSEVSSQLEGEIQHVDATTETGGTGATDGVVYTNAAYQAGDQKFAVYPAEAYGVGTVSTAEVAASDKAVIELHLGDNGLSEVAPGSGVFASNEVVCAVRQFTDTSGGHDGASLGCGDMEDYEASYQDALVFYEAYAASEPETLEGLAFLAPTITDGADGYKNANVPMQSTVGEDSSYLLFYFTPDSNEWNFFMSTKNSLSCELFTSDELKKSFDGHECITQTGEASTVRSE